MKQHIIIPAVKRILPCCLAACLLLDPAPGQAEQRYIVDTIVVSLRQGPGSNHKAIKTLQTGQAFEVLESQNGYSRVRTSDGTEGWVQEQFTTPRQPGEHALQVAELNDRIRELKTQNEELLKAAGAKVGPDGAPVHEGETEAVKRLRDKLEQEAREATAVREERDRLSQQVAELHKAVAEAQSAPDDPLRDPQSILWFLAGSGVLLVGWMIGKLSGRRQRQSLLS